MTDDGTLNDRGQAFPIYVVVVAGLLFAAFALFVVGRAGVTRSNAQGAADAAALAAARDARSHLTPGMDFATFQPKDWEDFLLGGRFDHPERACGKAEDFAARNDATVSCKRALLRFTVEAETKGTVGDSVIPGTGAIHGKATATAVVEPRCTLGSLPAEEPKPASVHLDCRGADVVIDPLKPEPWGTLAKSLFDVRLVD